MNIEEKDAPFQEISASEIINNNNEEESFLKIIAQIIVEIIISDIDESNRLFED